MYYFEPGQDDEIFQSRGELLVFSGHIAMVRKAVVME